jgi:hypothetical protein
MKLMKTTALFAALLAFSSTQAFSVCKHHFSGLASVKSVASPLTDHSAGAAPAMIKKCFPDCG